MAGALELHKIADKSGVLPETGVWPLSHVELRSEVPDVNEFPDTYVNQGLREGWITFQGKPFVYEVTPDPLGESQYLSAQKITLPGSQLVFHLRLAGKDVAVTYKITAGPAPRGYRIADGSAPHDFKVELEA